MGLAPDGRRTPKRLYNWREDRVTLNELVKIIIRG